LFLCIQRRHGYGNFIGYNFPGTVKLIDKDQPHFALGDFPSHWKEKMGLLMSGCLEMSRVPGSQCWLEGMVAEEMVNFTWFHGIAGLEEKLGHDSPKLQTDVWKQESCHPLMNCPSGF
jgi:hypothetical protein